MQRLFAIRDNAFKSTSMSDVKLKEGISYLLNQYHYGGADHWNDVNSMLTSNKYRKLVDNADGYTGCPHVFFVDCSQFVEHLGYAWMTLSKDDAYHQMHTDFIIFTIENRTDCICQKCAYYLLSQVRLRDIIFMWSKRDCWLETRCKSAGKPTPKSQRIQHSISVLTAQFNAALKHPKAPQFLTTLSGDEESQRYDMDAFDTVCSIAIQWCDKQALDFSNGKALDCTIDPLFNMLYFSIKFWKESHIIYFYNTHLLQYVESLSTLLNSDAAQCMKLFGKQYLQKLVKFNAYSTASKSQQLEVEGMLRVCGNDRHKGHMFTFEKIVKQCEWMFCDNSKREFEQLRLCKGCKVTYYCSKYCQKSSWSKWHAQDCKKLQMYYN
eukprot:40231_1